MNNTEKDLGELRTDLNAILKIISEFENTRKFDDKKLLLDFLEFERFYRKVKKGSTERILMGDLVNDYKEHKLDRHELTKFQLCFHRFIKLADDFDNFESFRKSIGEQFLQILYQMVGAAQNLIKEIDKILVEEGFKKLAN